MFLQTQSLFSICFNCFAIIISSLLSPFLFQVRALKDFFDMLSNVRSFPWNAWFLVFIVSNYFPNILSTAFLVIFAFMLCFWKILKIDWNCGFLIGSRSSLLWTKARGGCSWTHGCANSTHHRWVIQVSLIRVNLNIWTNRIPEMLKLFWTPLMLTDMVIYDCCFINIKHHINAKILAPWFNVYVNHISQ